MQRHCPALPLVADLDLQAEHVAELPLEGFKIGVNRLSAARQRLGRQRYRAPAALLAPRSLFCLPDGKASCE